MEMYLAENIRCLRKSKGINQKALGELLGVTGAQIGSYERGTNEPKFDSLLKLSQHFDVLIDDLITKNLQVEEARPAGRMPENAKEEDEMLRTMNDLLMKRVMQMEEELKKMNPERARELGIE